MHWRVVVLPVEWYCWWWYGIVCGGVVLSLVARTAGGWCGVVIGGVVLSVVVWCC